MSIISVLGEPWGITEEKLREITSIYSTHLRGEKIDIKALEAAMGRPLANQPKGYEVVDGVGILSLEGVIAKRMNLFTRISGGVSTQLFEREFNQAMDDPEVKSILLHVDSPGGTVDGTLEAARTVRAARGKKPVYTLADGMMASAAYWIGSAGDKVFITGDTTHVGSIGVITQHFDETKALEKQGLKVTTITAGKYKAIGMDGPPLTEEGRESIQDRLDHIYSAFVRDVAEHRGKSPDQVHEKMADGRLFTGMSAIKVGLADGVATMPEVIELLKEAAKSTKGAVAPKSTTKGQADMEHVLVSGATCKTQEEVDAAVKAAVEKAETAAKASGNEEGAKAERERIKAIESRAVLGHKELVEAAKFDGKTTAEQLDAQIVQAEIKLKSDAKSKLEKGGDPAKVDASVDEGKKAPEQPKQDAKVLAAKISDYVAEQAKAGRTVSYAQAAEHLSKQAQ
jgi:signal peptide peptidase SppA